MTGTLRLGRAAALLVSTALSAILTAPAFSQSAGAPTDPDTWRTPEYLAQWGLDFIYAADAYALGLDGSGVKVGVVDSGLDTNHLEFIGRFAEGITYNPSQSWNVDTTGHGTSVASVIAANRDGVGMHGVAPGATIVAANRLGGDGYGDLYGISSLIDQGVRIINNSYGLMRPITDTTAEDEENSLAKELAVYRRAVAADTLLIWATANEGWAQPDILAGLPYLFPEFERGWLAVTAVGPDYMPDWANRCGVAKNWCLAAPGGGPGWSWDPVIGDWAWYGVDDGIYVAKPDGGYEKTLGTSFAAPHVAGAAALVSQMFPYMTMEQVRQVLLGTAWDIGDPGVDEYFGYGLLDVGMAVRGPGKFDWGDFHAVIDEGRSVWANDITGAGGLVKSGDGVLILTGDSTYLGDTHANGGVLAIGGSIASQTFVGPEGMLSGNGTIFGDVDNGGAVYAGWNRDGGTLTIDGDYRQRENSWLVVELGAPDGTSRLDVTGAATIEGGAVDVGFESGGYGGDARHTILSADGGVTGRFEDVCNCYAFLDFDLSYDPTNVYLDVTRNAVAFAALAATANGAAAARSIEGLGIGNSVHDAIIGLGAADAGDAFPQLSGELHASVSGTLIETSGMLNSAAAARLRSAFADSGAPALPVMAYGPGRPDLAPVDTERFAVWTEALGAWGETDGDGNAAALDRSSGGVLFGGDAGFGDNWRLGVLGGYSHTSFESDETASTGSAKNIHLGLYGGAEWGNIALRTGAAYTWHDIETQRTVAFPGFADRLSADYDAGAAQAFGELGYHMETGGFRFEPFAGLAYVNLRTDGFTERGGASALTSAASTTDTAFSTLGLHAETDFSLGSLDATARGTIGWRHAFGDVTPAAGLAFTGGSAFDVEGLPIARDALLLEAGLDAAITNAASVGLSYAGQVASKAQDHSFKADLTVKF